jgi:hypothetical protein
LTFQPEDLVVVAAAEAVALVEAAEVALEVAEGAVSVEAVGAVAVSEEAVVEASVEVVVVIEEAEVVAEVEAEAVVPLIPTRLPTLVELLPSKERNFHSESRLIISIYVPELILEGVGA